MNVPESILRKKQIGGLHHVKNHPIQIIKQKVYDSFSSDFVKFDNQPVEVSTSANFDDLLIPQDHPCRSPSDTYYMNKHTVLRTHTSAHQTELLRQGHLKFLVTGDVYRKDEINNTHYPVFHQMEGVCVSDDFKTFQDAIDDLQQVMKNLLNVLFPNCNFRINPDYFPFTHPSYEIEVEYNGKWLEVAGCGIIHSEILKNVGLENKHGWAFGFGLERLAMILFKIPDIRLFWSSDPKLLDQFKDGVISEFKAFSVLDPLSKDLSFFIPDLKKDEEPWKQVNDFYDLCRDVAGDSLCNVERFNSFYHPAKQKMSHSYRLTYSPPDSLVDPGKFNQLVNTKHAQIYKLVKEKLNVIMR